MTLDQAVQLLRAPGPAGRGEVIQAVLVILAHARQQLDSGDIRGARELARHAERGLQALRLHVLEPLMDKARVAGLLRDRPDAAYAAIHTLDRVFEGVMRSPRPIKAQAFESMSPEAALAWLTGIALDVDPDRQGLREQGSEQ